MTAAARLSDATLGEVPAAVARPAYDRAGVTAGIVHFGPGVFHRVHQAAFVDRLLRSDPRWAINAVALRGSAARDGLRPQNGLYTVAELGDETRFRIIGSLKEIYAARDEADAVFAHLTAPATRIVTITVTEGGYCLTPSGDLDDAAPAIRHDLRSPQAPTSLIGWLVAALRRRRMAGLPPFVTLSCDNLSDNGIRLKQAVVTFARALSPDLANWIDGEARFPRTMVDSIAPATDEALKSRVAGMLGLWDAAPVQHEKFSQWVIEDCGMKDGPDWASVGVIVSRNVDAYERAKLRLLNGAHSSLAYLGLLAGKKTVSEAMRDPVLADFLRTMMREDIAPTLGRSEINLTDYIDDILRRFRNPGLVHYLGQIAWDGSQKLPYRLFEAIGDALALRRPIDRMALSIAAWLRFVIAQTQDGGALIDPLHARLEQIARACNGGASHDVVLFLAFEAVFPPRLSGDPRFRNAVIAAYDALGRGVPHAIARASGTLGVIG